MGSSKSFVLARVTQNRWTILGIKIWMIFEKWALIQVYLPLFIHWHHCFLKIRCVLFKVEELLQYVKSSCWKDGHGSLPSLAPCTPVSCCNLNPSAHTRSSLPCSTFPFFSSTSHLLLYNMNYLSVTFIVYCPPAGMEVPCRQSSLPPLLGSIPSI